LGYAQGLIFLERGCQLPTIRDATRNDIPDLAQLIHKAYRDVAQKFNLTPTNCPSHPSNCQPEWLEKSIDKGIEYFILENEKSLCGCAALEQADPNVCYLERLAVLPPYRHKGYGRALVQHGLTAAAARGVNRVEIAIITQHADLKAWYKQLGFRATHTRAFDHLPFDVTFMVTNPSSGHPVGGGLSSAVIF